MSSVLQTSKVKQLKRSESITNDAPSVRARTVVETDTPGVLGWAGGNVGGSGVSTTGPPSIVSSRGKICWTAGASTISLRDIGDSDAFELLHPGRHLFGEQGWERFWINEFQGIQQTKSTYTGRQRHLGQASLPSCKRLKERVRTTRAAKMRVWRTRRRERRSTAPGWTRTSGVGGTWKDGRAGGHSRGQ